MICCRSWRLPRFSSFGFLLPQIRNHKSYIRNSAILDHRNRLLAAEVRASHAAALLAHLVRRAAGDDIAAESTGRRDRDRGRRAAAEPAARSGTIASRAAAEYAYVMRDVRKIVVIGGGLIVALIALWAVITATGVGPF